MDLNETTLGLTQLLPFWDWSPARWSIELFWLKEVEARPYIENTKPPSNMYKWDNYPGALGSMFLIALSWHFIAYMTLKLLNRDKQK